MSGTLAISGWGQPYDALAAVVPDAAHAHYARYTSVEDALAAIATVARDCEYVVGWSLGGQLAVRAIAAGMMKPRRLTLIATPFQFVETPKLKLGMKRDTFEKFRGNYEANPKRTIDKAWELVVKGDTRPAAVREHLTPDKKEQALKFDWLSWLHMLDGYSCDSLDFSEFPPTLLVHGAHDVVVAPDQSARFAQAIPQATHVEWKGCGHAPHWHNTDGLKQLIAKHHV
jgi:pimeloyl-ACP methyl ester carboxylesterase